MTLTVRGYVLDRVCSLSGVYLIGGDRPKPFLSKGMSGPKVEHSLAKNVYGDESDEISVQDFGVTKSSTGFEPDGMEFIYACKFRDMFHQRLLTTRKGYVGLAHV